jgi:hypothetical protein
VADLKHREQDAAAPTRFVVIPIGVVGEGRKGGREVSRTAGRTSNGRVNDETFAEGTSHAPDELNEEAAREERLFPSYRTLFSFEAVGTEKSLAITLIFPSESLFTGNTAEKCTNDFPIF